MSVLIAGAGPTGLTLACELARRGVPFHLIESEPGPRPGSRGKGVQPRTLEVLDSLGLAEQVIANGRMSMPIRVTAPDGTQTLANAQAPDARPDVPYTASLTTPEWRVEEALRSRLEALGGSVDFDAQLRTVQQSDGEVVASVLRDGRVERLSARWLVGCDGGHSVVRRQAGIAFEGETRVDVRMIVADVHVDGLPADAWHMWRHEEGLVNLCPLPSTDLFQFQAGIEPGQDPELSLANVQAIFEARSGRTDVRLLDATWMSLWRANVRLADRYREGRVLLAGDAAHIHSPAGGLGMNTGIQDAHNLGWKLAAVEQGASVELLGTYEAERRTVAADVLALSDARLAATLRDNAIPTRRTADTTQLSIEHRQSTLSRDDRDEDAALRAGDRAPDATGLETASAGRRRLFELTRDGRFTLLQFGAAAAPEVSQAQVNRLRVVERPGGPGEVADVDGHLAGAYGATERTLVLIRPDGYIGLISDAGDASAVPAYLAAAMRWS